MANFRENLGREGTDRDQGHIVDARGHIEGLLSGKRKAGPRPLSVDVLGALRQDDTYPVKRWGGMLVVS